MSDKEKEQWSREVEKLADALNTRALSHDIDPDCNQWYDEVVITFTNTDTLCLLDGVTCAKRLRSMAEVCRSLGRSFDRAAGFVERDNQ
jgi:hypothetical protein